MHLNFFIFIKKKAFEKKNQLSDLCFLVRTYVGSNLLSLYNVCLKSELNQGGEKKLQNCTNKSSVSWKLCSPCFLFCHQFLRSFIYIYLIYMIIAPLQKKSSKHSDLYHTPPRDNITCTGVVQRFHCDP